MTIEIEEMILRLRKIKPLVLNLTNYVTMDFMANCLLSLGAAPIMSVCDEELEDLVKIANSVNINLGTLDELFINRCRKALELAKLHKKPIILDPAGSGASSERTKAARGLLADIDILKANASEILSLYDSNSKTLGVESVNSTDDAKEAARKISRCYQCTVIVSGPVDFISNSKDEVEVGFGSDLMPIINGMGCSLAAVVAAFRAVMSNSFKSARIATQYFGLCGTIAGRMSNHPGSFRTEFIDALYRADFSLLQGRQLLAAPL